MLEALVIEGNNCFQNILDIIIISRSFIKTVILLIHKY